MTVKDFCEKYQITPQAVYAKIKRKAALLDSHVLKSNGQLEIDDYAEKLLKPRCTDLTLLEKVQNLKTQLDEKTSECEELKKSLADEISKNENLQVLLNKKTSKIEDLENQLAKQNSKNADFENLAAALKTEILNISEKIDSVQISISEITKRSSGGLAGLLKK